MDDLTLPSSTPRRARATACLGGLLLVGAAATGTTTTALLAAPEPSGAAVYCVEKQPDYVLGMQVHPGVRRCVPGP